MRSSFAAGLLVLACAASQAAPSGFTVETALHQEAARRVDANQFEPLLAQADAFLQTQERLPDGRWKLAVLLGGVRNRLLANPARDWDGVQSSLVRLARSHPASPDAWLLVALAEYCRAWQLRGNATPEETGSARMAAFHDHLRRARDLLEQHAAATNPAWFDLRLRIASGLGDPFPAQDRLFRAAIKLAPAYQQVWITYLFNLQPQWGGSDDAMAALIREAGKVTSPSEGRGMMARLLAAAVQMHSGGLAGRAGIGWDDAKASFADLMQHYPDDYNAQVLAFMACEHADKAETRRLLGLMKAPAEPGALRDNDRVFGLCVDWANGKIPEFAMRDHELGTVKLIK